MHLMKYGSAVLRVAIRECKESWNRTKHNLSACFLLPWRQTLPVELLVPHLELGDDGGPPVFGAALQRLLLVATQHVLKQIVDKVQPGKDRAASS